MTEPRNLDERVLGLLMGLGVGVFIGFFLRNRQAGVANGTVDSAPAA